MQKSLGWSCVNEVMGAKASWLKVSCEETTEVKADSDSTEQMVQNTVKTRPVLVLGAKSPRPNVLSETASSVMNRALASARASKLR